MTSTTFLPIGLASLAMTLSFSCAAPSGTSMMSPVEAPATATKRPVEAPATCPVMGASAAQPEQRSMSNPDWWPNSLKLGVLEQNSPQSNPMGPDFDYAAEFKTLDLDAVKQDLKELMTSSQDWWPADWGNYGPLFIRLAWHSAGTYRLSDGRGGVSGGAQRFAPLNSWPDNANLDKARRLLWPIKKKYGKKLSWADLMVLAGTTALEDSGLHTFGFGGGREDVWEPQDDIYWGPEGKWLADERRLDDGDLEGPLAAVQMGLIYVNPEGPGGNPDPLLAAQDIRRTFTRMSMNDEETVALIAGGHTLGKVHGAADPSKYVGPEPEAAPLEQQGLGWKNSFGTGKGADTITSGLEGAWNSSPTKWSSGFLENLYEYDWELTTSPAGAHQWTPIDGDADVRDAHIKGKFNKPILLTTDLALRMDPIYGPISKRFYEHPGEFNDAFARAWFKLTHRDMGPASRLLGPDVPEPQLWQDPIPAATYPMIDDGDVATLKGQILDSGLTVPQLVSTAWASASTFRASDKRGGANGARLNLAPEKDWAINASSGCADVIAVLSKIETEFNDAHAGGKQVSLADLIVLGGTAAVEEAAKNAGHPTTVQFSPGRTDATQEMTDVTSFAALEPRADAFRNFVAEDNYRRPEEAMVDQADLLDLTVPELTVLIGGMRALDVNANGTKWGIFTEHPGALTNDFFVNLLDMGTEWTPAPGSERIFEGRDRESGKLKWTATNVDLVFGSNAQLRAVAEAYACDDAQQKFADDFAAAWTKVMNLDRFDL